MGDRRSVVVHFNNGASVALYTHWDGNELPSTVADALERGKVRWGDDSYLTRVIFSEMIKDSVLDTTGYGIEPVISGEFSYCEASPGYDLEVNLHEQTIYDGSDTLTFEEFITTHQASRVS